jgi:hypothetical protein
MIVGRRELRLHQPAPDEVLRAWARVRLEEGRKATSEELPRRRSVERRTSKNPKQAKFAKFLFYELG